MTDDVEVNPAMVAAIRKQIMEQMQTEEEFKRQQRIDQIEAEKKAHDAYVSKMKDSSEPWVEVLGAVDTSQGVRIELDWNTAFVEYLRENGVTGIDDEQIMQQYITLLLRDMAETMSDASPEQSEYS
jgi:hypothetical protein